MRLSGTKVGAVNQYRGFGDVLYDKAALRPTLDLNFANNESLVDSITGKNLVTHTRASSATYVDGDGAIKSAVTNLLLQSENLTVSPWTSVGAVVTEDYTQGVPFEGAKVYKIVFSAANQAVSQGISYLAKDYAASIYVKGTQGDVVRFSGKTGQSAANYTLNGEWERLSQTFTATAVTANFNINTSGLSAVTVYVAAPQLEQSSTVGEYVKTTSTINSAPRFDHDPATGESLGLLVEEARTNLITYSEELDNAAYLKTNSQVTPNQAVAPDGTMTADFVSAVTTGTVRIAQPITVTTGVDYTASVYLKAGTETSCFWREDTHDSLSVTVDLSAGTINVSGGSGTITNVGNGWYRVTLTGSVSGTQWKPEIRLLSASGGIYAWGWQLEAGSFATSYIPTEGSTVTRAADVTEITGNDFGTFNLLQYSEEFDQASWFTGGSGTLTVTPNVIEAPDGTFTADRIVYSAASTALRQNLTITNGASYTFSVYVKGVSGETIRMSCALDTSPKDFTLTGGWDRLVLSGTSTQAATAFDINTYGGSTARDIYVWGAQLEESSTATPYVKSDVTWTSRASNATYYDYTGTLKKSSYNRFTYSEDLSNAIWSTGDVNNLSQVVGPNGETAWSMDLPLKTNDANVQQTLTAVNQFADGEPCTLSFYIRSQTGYGTQSLKAKMGRTSAFGSGVFSITEDWQRISVVDDGDSIGNTKRHFGLQATEGDVFIEATGFQVETGPYAGDYAKTEGSAASSARTSAYLPDGNGNFVSAGELLLEDAGTNLITYSEDFYQWVAGNCPVTTDAITAPDGTLTADKLVANTNNTDHLRYVSVATTSGVVSTMSVYAKAAEYNQIAFLLGAGGYGSTVKVAYNLTSGTYQINSYGTNTTASIEPAGNGWYRCICSSEATATATPQHQIRVLNENGDETYEGDNVKGVYVWGAQAEQSSYATSYIPTFGATATRAADVSSSSSNTFGNSFYKQSEGTVFAFAERPDSSRLNTVAVSITDGTGNNRLELRTSDGAGNQNSRMQINSSGVAQFTQAGLLSDTAYKKLALAYATNDAQAAANGLAGGIDSTVSIPVVSKLFLGNDVFSTAYRPGHIKRLTFWPQRLPVDILKTITS